VKTAFGFTLRLAILIGLAVFLADHPGQVTLSWPPYVLETSVAVLAVLLAGAFIMALSIYRIMDALRRGPSRWEARQQLKRYEQDQKRLIRNLADIMLGGRDVTASKTLQDRSSQSVMTDALALKATLEAGDYPKALTLARKQAARLQTPSPTLAALLVNLEARARNWDAARMALTTAVKGKAIAPEGAETLSAALYLAAGDAEAALKAKKGWLPALIAQSRMLIAGNNRKAALRLIEKQVTGAPHPDLAQLYLDADTAADPLTQFAHLEKIWGKAGDFETLLALAGAANKVRLWGQARHYADKAAACPTADRRAFHLLAQIEKAETGQTDAVIRHLEQAAIAPAEPIWHCADCGTPAPDWTALCPACGAFATFHWGRSRETA
jgi:HemY protein